VKPRNVLAVILAGLLVAVSLPATPVTADDETATEAEVEVLPGTDLSYGAWVVSSRFTLFRWRVLGEPDYRGASILWNGWAAIKLERRVPDANKISIWAGRLGWSSAVMKIYVSADGRRWRKVCSANVRSSHFQRYDFYGRFGNVQYIKVSRSGGRWSLLYLDAVGAEGGD
jgi:hypothetical protein